jgi:hypothetical protein
MRKIFLYLLMAGLAFSPLASTAVFGATPTSKAKSSYHKSTARTKAAAKKAAKKQKRSHFTTSKITHK